MNPNAQESITKTNAAPKKLKSNTAIKVRNLLIVLAAIALTVSIFLGLQTETPSTTLTEMAKASTPLEVALSNGKPTLLEFYANWCNSCQAMAKDLKEIKHKYSDRVNFAMLNVDNNKWLPEILKYRVDGIPHFVFLSNKGEAIAQTIGEAPSQIIEKNLDALMSGKSLPYAQATGQVSSFNVPLTPANSNATDPRSHGSQVQ
jgi:thiol-disulfide isomerase/thioredoxin